MDPVVDGFVSLSRHALRDFTFMVGEHEVKTATMYVELLAEVFLTHRGALKMPPGKPFAPGGWPVHDVFRRSLFPKGEIHRITFLFLTVEGTGRVLEVFYVSAGKDSVSVVFVIFLHIEIYRALAFIGISRFKNFLDIFDLFDYVSRCMRLDAWRQYIESFHIMMVAVQV